MIVISVFPFELSREAFYEFLAASRNLLLILLLRTVCWKTENFVFNHVRSKDIILIPFNFKFQYLKFNIKVSI